MLTAAGATILSRSEPEGGPKPTHLTVRWGRRVESYRVYAWHSTHEGKTRVGDNLRVQVTRSHNSPLKFSAGTRTLGIGHLDLGHSTVFGAFDPWVKRFAGSSSSVHFHRDFLESAARSGWETEVRPEGPQCAFTADNLQRFFDWDRELQRPRTIVTRPETYTNAGPTAVLKFNAGNQRRESPWLRPGDTVVLHDDKALVDNLIWRVDRIEPLPDENAIGRDSNGMNIHCTRHGRLQDPTAFYLGAST